MTHSRNEKVFAHLRYVDNVSDCHGFDLLAQFQKDEFRLIDSRVVYGGGYRYEWQRGPDDQRGLLGIGTIHERATYIDRVAEQDLWRANVYVSIGRECAPIPDSWLTFSAYAQPAFADTSDSLCGNPSMSFSEKPLRQGSTERIV